MARPCSAGSRIVIVASGGVSIAARRKIGRIRACAYCWTGRCRRRVPACAASRRRSPDPVGGQVGVLDRTDPDRPGHLGDGGLVQVGVLLPGQLRCPGRGLVEQVDELDGAAGPAAQHLPVLAEDRPEPDVRPVVHGEVDEPWTAHLHRRTTRPGRHGRPPRPRRPAARGRAGAPAAAPRRTGNPYAANGAPPGCPAHRPQPRRPARAGRQEASPDS